MNLPVNALKLSERASKNNACKISITHLSFLIINQIQINREEEFNQNKGAIALSKYYQK